MAHPNYQNTRFGSTCPPTHPVVLPEVMEIFTFPVPTGGSSTTWRLTSDMYSASMPGGYSAHADWMMGWDVATMRTMVTACLNRGNDCGVNVIGNNTALY